MSKLEMAIENQVRTPRASVGVYELPCGVLDDDGKLRTTLVVRGIKGREEDLLGNARIPPEEKISQLLSRCVVKIGEVEDPAGISRLLDKMPAGDRIVAFVSIRRVSLGDEFPFMVKCPVPHCDWHKNAQLFMQSLELPVIPMADRMRRVGELTLPASGLVARYHVMTYQDEVRLAKARKQARRVSDAANDDEEAATVVLLGRVDTIDGKPATIEALQELSLEDRNALREAFEEMEGGLDLSCELECRACGYEWSVNLDVTQEGFFFPSAVSKRWKRKYAS